LAVAWLVSIAVTPRAPLRVATIAAGIVPKDWSFQDQAGAHAKDSTTAAIINVAMLEDAVCAVKDAIIINTAAVATGTGEKNERQNEAIMKSAFTSLTLQTRCGRSG
jgi:hypothetical protein